MKNFKSQKNCADYLGNGGIFAETRDTTTTTTTTTTKKSDIQKAGLAGAALKIERNSGQ